MKFISALLACFLIAGVLGCSGTDKDRATASSGSMPSFPNEAQGAAGASAGAPPLASYPDAHAAGGSNLGVSTPYQSKGPAVTQNINAQPFLSGDQAMRGTSQQADTAGGLVSRRDGTMFGPTDLPAAGIGPGMQGAAESGATGGRGTRGGGGLSAPVKPAADQTSGK